MTTMDLLVHCSIPPFSVWEFTKQIAISYFLEENAAQTFSVLVEIADAPAIESVCDESNHEYLL